MSITTAAQQGYVRRLDEYAAVDMRFLRRAYDEAHWGQREPNDAEFLTWFALMARSGPEWVLALPLDDGSEGARILRRYERLTGLDREPRIPGISAPAEVI